MKAIKTKMFWLNNGVYIACVIAFIIFAFINPLLEQSMPMISYSGGAVVSDVSQILAAPMPMSAYSSAQTIGNRIAGGESGGFWICVLYSSIPSRDRNPDKPPTASENRIKKT